MTNPLDIYTGEGDDDVQVTTPMVTSTDPRLSALDMDYDDTYTDPGVMGVYASSGSFPLTSPDSTDGTHAQITQTISQLADGNVVTDQFVNIRDTADRVTMVTYKVPVGIPAIKVSGADPRRKRVVIWSPGADDFCLGTEPFNNSTSEAAGPWVQAVYIEITASEDDLWVTALVSNTSVSVMAEYYDS